MEWIENDNGKVKHCCGIKNPDDSIPVRNWTGISGEPWEYYNKSGDRLSDVELCNKGLLIDDKGIYYDENKNEHKIESFGIKKEYNWTKNKWNHVTDILVGNNWIEQLELKKKYEQNIINQECLNYLTYTDWYVIRFNETGEPIPEEIKAKRAESRIKIIKE